MYVESFHRVLKHVYLKGKVNKRIDKCIHTLLLYAQDKAFDKLIKLHKGKATHRISSIVSRHMASRSIEQKTIEACNDNTWMVRSATSEHVYSVVKQTDICPVNCCIRCRDCNICIHNYTCRCPYSTYYM